MTDKQYKELMNKLNQISKLLSLQILPGETLTERVRILKSIGLTVGEISEVLNISEPSVRTLSSRTKKIK